MAQESFTLKELEEMPTTEDLERMKILKAEEFPEYMHFGGGTKEEQLNALKAEKTDTVFIFHRIDPTNLEIIQVPCSDIHIDWRKRYMELLEQVCVLDLQEGMSGKEFRTLVGNMCARKFFNGDLPIEERQKRLSGIAEARVQMAKGNFKAAIESRRASVTEPNISNIPKHDDNEFKGKIIT
jgi:hypothetical protein